MVSVRSTKYPVCVYTERRSVRRFNKVNGVVSDFRFDSWFFFFFFLFAALNNYIIIWMILKKEKKKHRQREKAYRTRNVEHRPLSILCVFEFRLILGEHLISPIYMTIAA